MKRAGTMEVLQRFMVEYDPHESVRFAVTDYTAQALNISFKEAADLWDKWDEERDRSTRADEHSNICDYVEGRLENEAMCLEE